MNKKGISPLIATVLLIGFTIALAAIVMTWGTSFIKGTAEQVGTTAQKTMSCASLNLDIKGYDCNAGTVTIANNNDLKIVKLTFRNYDNKNNILLEGGKSAIEIPGTEEQPALGNFDVKAVKGLVSSGDIYRVEVIPTLEGGVTCAEAPVSKQVICKK